MSLIPTRPPGRRTRAISANKERSSGVTVCDRAHEELQPGASWLHWSIDDPVARPSNTAFDTTVAALRDRITALVDVA